MTIYYSRPFTGKKISDLRKQLAYFKETIRTLLQEEKNSFTIIDPMGKKLDVLRQKFPELDDLNQAVELYGEGYFSDRFLFKSDFLGVQTCDIMICDIRNMEVTSIGCCFELAWAFQLQRPIFLIIDKQEKDLHPFLKECATAICNNSDDLIKCLSHYTSIPNVYFPARHSQL